MKSYIHKHTQHGHKKLIKSYQNLLLLFILKSVLFTKLIEYLILPGLIAFFKFVYLIYK